MHASMQAERVGVSGEQGPTSDPPCGYHCGAFLIAHGRVPWGCFGGGHDRADPEGLRPHWHVVPPQHRTLSNTVRSLFEDCVLSLVCSLWMAGFLLSCDVVASGLPLAVVWLADGSDTDGW